VLIDFIFFKLAIISTADNAPEGYLFLCPSEQLKTGLSSFQWPKCPAYWSFDPTGAQRLGEEEAAALGFPTINLELSVNGKYWNASAYEGLRKFHLAKGFDPDSLDVARHLRYALCKLSNPSDITLPGEPNCYCFAGTNTYFRSLR
jgi:hypothetical protein